MAKPLKRNPPDRRTRRLLIETRMLYSAISTGEPTADPTLDVRQKGPGGEARRVMRLPCQALPSPACAGGRVVTVAHSTRASLVCEPGELASSPGPPPLWV